MAKTPKYPNPKFFKAKDNIDWKKQWENLKVCGGIFYEMFKETDWEAFKNGWKNRSLSKKIWPSVMEITFVGM